MSESTPPDLYLKFQYTTIDIALLAGRVAVRLTAQAKPCSRWMRPVGGGSKSRPYPCAAGHLLSIKIKIEIKIVTIHLDVRR